MLAQILEQTRAKSPLVHCMTNLVTANDCANLVLASGASPIMAEDLGEAAEITSVCDGLVLNLGTPNPRKIEAMLQAAHTANSFIHPVIFDPVGVGSSAMRREAALRLLEQTRIAVIRGNASEIRTLVSGTTARRGVDVDKALGRHEDVQFAAQCLARRTGAVVVASGDADVVTDGRVSFLVHNGHPMMRSVTGTGCQASCLIGAYVAANPGQTLTAALAAVCAMGLCGQLAYKRLGSLDGNASYRNYIIDALYHLRGVQLEEGADYEIC